MESAAQLEVHRRALTGHCYRMLGSASDADDAVQETLIRALRGVERLSADASLRAWLYRIATNVCLDALSDRGRRGRPREEGSAGTPDDGLETRPRTHWLEPIPDADALPSDSDPAEAAILRQSIRLAFVAALQHLPPRQRAALLLADVLGWSAQEIAEALETTPASVNSALQRARATLAERDVEQAPALLTEEQAQAVQAYVDAFQRYDLDALARLLTDDVVLSMPPHTLWLQGPALVRRWMAGKGAGCAGSVLVPAPASGLPAFAQYRDGGKTPWALLVLELSGPRVRSVTSFLDVETLFPRFGLPVHR